MKRGCWAPGGGACQSSKGKGKDGGKGGKSKGNGKDKDKSKSDKMPSGPWPKRDDKPKQGFQGCCSLCWGWGHKRVDCGSNQSSAPTRRGANSLEESAKQQEPETEQPGGMGSLGLCTLELNVMGEDGDHFYPA
eukprot:8996530-Pyramimonas_sp.AAC.1